jgi:hypothetical protein
VGREAVCTTTWQGVTGNAKVLLESNEIIVRGEIRARIPRTGIVGVVSLGDELVVDVAGEPLTLVLGRNETAKWAAALLKTPPTLTEKLGLRGDQFAFVLGIVDDEVLTKALSGVTTISLADADMIVAVLRSEEELAGALETAREVGLPVWIIGGKGKTAQPSDSAIRAFMRAGNYIDNKTSAVSDSWTATRYGPR